MADTKELKRVCCEQMRRFIEDDIIAYDKELDECFIKPSGSGELIDFGCCPFCGGSPWGFGEESL